MDFWINDMDPVAFMLLGVPIRWYSIAYIAAFLFAIFYLHRVDKRLNLHYTSMPGFMDALMLYCALGVVAGGRLGHVLLYDLLYYLRHPLEVLYVWQGGMSFHGGLIGVLVATRLVTKKYHIAFIGFMDILAPASAFGIGLGRVANFVNSELFGVVTNAPWAVVFAKIDSLPRHPTQLYEAFFEGIALFLVLDCMLCNNAIRRRPGLVTGSFAALYGLCRCVIEFFKVSDLRMGYIAGIFTMGQLLSFLMLLLGIFIALGAIKRGPIDVDVLRVDAGSA